LLKVNQSAEDSWPVVVMLAVGMLITRLLVEVVMLKILPAVPVETLLMLLTEPKPKEEVAMEERFLLASAKTSELAVKVEMLMLPRAETWNNVEPVEEETVNKGNVGFVVVPLIAKTAKGVVVPIPMLPLDVILSLSFELPEPPV